MILQQSGLRLRSNVDLSASGPLSELTVAGRLDLRLDARFEPDAGSARTEPRLQLRPEPHEAAPVAAEPEPRSAEPEEPRRAPQKIVALRVVAPPGAQFEGSQLLDAAPGDGFTFGRYQIFHQLDETGRPRVSLASLKEPGTFDPERMPGMQFRGVALFTVIPGPLPALRAFDELVVTARALATTLGGHLQDERGGPLTVQPWIIVLFAALFVLLALAMFGVFNLQVPAALQARLADASNRQKQGTLIGTAVMGALSSLIVTACVAPPLVAALAVIGQSGDVVRGAAVLFALSLGMGVPLLVVGASAGQLLPRAGPWMDAIKAVFGVMLLAVAVWMLGRILPGPVTLALWATLAFVSGYCLLTLGGREVRKELYRMLDDRVDVMVKAGLIEEVAAFFGQTLTVLPFRR